MSLKFSVINNRKKKHPKVNFGLYLFSPDEPRINNYDNSQTEIEAELLDDKL